MRQTHHLSISKHIKGIRSWNLFKTWRVTIHVLQFLCHRYINRFCQTKGKVSLIIISVEWKIIMGVMNDNSKVSEIAKEVNKLYLSPLSYLYSKWIKSALATLSFLDYCRFQSHSVFPNAECFVLNFCFFFLK